MLELLWVSITETCRNFNTIKFVITFIWTNPFLGINLDMELQIKLDKDHLDFGTCFIRYAYSRTCTLSNCALVCGKFEVQEQDSQTQSTTAKLTAVPTKGVVEEESLASIEYSLSTLMLGEISFVTAVIANPGPKEQTLPLRIEALSIGMSSLYSFQIITLSSFVWHKSELIIPLTVNSRPLMVLQ